MIKTFLREYALFLLYILGGRLFILIITVFKIWEQTHTRVCGLIHPECIIKNFVGLHRKK